VGQGIVSSRVAWEFDHVDMSADDAMQKTREAPERDDAENFLREKLSGGPMKQAEIKDEGVNGRGFSWATLRRSQNRLGVVSRKSSVDGPWMWTLPDPFSNT
jgi:hypothetical protein